MKIRAFLPLGLCLFSVSMTGVGGLGPLLGAIVSGLISIGTSFAGQTLSTLVTSQGVKVTCGIEVENWTKFPLTDPQTWIDQGRIKTHPRTVFPAVKEVMIAAKWPKVATGSYGTVSWLIQIGNTWRRIVVMWSAPFSFDLHSNWLGVGITRVGYTRAYKGWYKQMYYLKPATGLSGYNIRRYRNGIADVIYSDDKIIVRGSMSSSHHAKVYITVEPKNKSDFADKIRQKIASG